MVHTRDMSHSRNVFNQHKQPGLSATKTQFSITHQQVALVGGHLLPFPLGLLHFHTIEKCIYGSQEAELSCSRDQLIYGPPGATDPWGVVDLSGVPNSWIYGCCQVCWPLTADPLTLGPLTPDPWPMASGPPVWACPL